MVDTPDSKSGGASRGGSSPPTGTTPLFKSFQNNPKNPLQAHCLATLPIFIIQNALSQSIYIHKPNVLFNVLYNQSTLC